MEGENCIRVKQNIGGTDYYIILGDDFLMIKYAFENRRDEWEDREKLELLCEKVTEMMEVQNFKAFKNDEQEE